MRQGVLWTSSLVLVSFLAGCAQSEAEEAVRRQMKDPDATEFREVTSCAADRQLYKGEYNAKNSFGAYTGFKPFYWSAATGPVFLEDSSQFSGLTDQCFGQIAASPNDNASAVQEAAPEAAAAAAKAASEAANAAASEAANAKQ